MTVPANSNWPIIFYALKMLIPKLPRVVAQINAVSVLYFQLFVTCVD